MAQNADWVINFDKIKLTIELVPMSSHFTNLRSMLKSKDWDKVRKAAYSRAKNKCEICGGVGKRHPVEAHEEWEYNEHTGVQKLVKIRALCPNCHEVKHIGLATVRNRFQPAKNHLMTINNWNEPQADTYIAVVKMVWEFRNKIAWTLDISLVTDWLGEAPNV